MYAETGTLNPTPPFDFDKSLNFLGVFMPTKQEQTIKGIGEWSATFIMVRGLGRMEYIPLTETRLLEAASKVYGHGKELSREELIHLAERYGPWQGYWAHYLRVGT